MKKMNWVIDTLDLYLSSKCNLKCEYCFISKNDKYYSLDDDIQNALKNNIFFEHAKKVIKDKKDLKKITFWGGEPVLGLPNFLLTIKNFTEYFPNLKNFSISSNFTCNIEPLFELFKFLINLETEIKFYLQISLDGPDYINERNRGIGTNKKIESNLIKLIEFLNNTDLKKLKIISAFKPTFTIDSVRTLISENNSLDTNVSNLYNYFNYFSNLNKTTIDNCKKSDSFKMETNSMPSMMQPGQYTVEDGKLYALYIEALETLNIQNKKEKVLPLYKELSFFRRAFLNSQKVLSSNQRLGFCGIFRNKVAITHNGMATGCHRGYPDVFKDYLNSLVDINDSVERGVFLNDQSILEKASDSFKFKIGDESDRDFIIKKIRNIYESHNVHITNISSLIYECSLSNQALKVYSEDYKKLLQASIMIRIDTPCLYDNIMSTGSYFMQSTSKIHLYCNGAIEVMDNLYKIEGGIN